MACPNEYAYDCLLVITIGDEVQLIWVSPIHHDLLTYNANHPIEITLVRRKDPISHRAS